MTAENSALQKFRAKEIIKSKICDLDLDMTNHQKYRITNYLNAAFKDAYVSTPNADVDLSRTIAFLAGHALNWSEGNAELSNSDVAELLVRFYHCERCEISEDAKEIDVQMALKEFFLLGRALPEFDDLLNDPTLNVEGVLKAIEDVRVEAFS